MGRTRARRTIQAELSVSGINRLIGELKNYQSSIVKANELFVKRLVDEGYEVASASVIEALPTIDRDKPIGTLDILTDASGEIASLTLQFSGEQALFIEFGSGIKYNDEGKGNPWSSQYGYGVGTYPGQTHARDENGWDYYGEDGRFHHSYGTKATMPMYNASTKMRRDIIRIAKEVFQGVI